MASSLLPSMHFGRRVLSRLKLRHLQQVRSIKTKATHQTSNALAFAAGLVSSFAAYEYLVGHVRSHQERKPFPNLLIFADSEENDSEEEKPKPKAMSRREKRFNQFASCEFEGQILMTAQDFIESLTENEPKCRFLHKRLLCNRISS